MTGRLALAAAGLRGRLLSPHRRRRGNLVRTLALVLAGAMAAGNVAAQTTGPATKKPDARHMMLGLTGTQLAVSAGVGLGIGATAAFIAGGRLRALMASGTLAGLGVTTLAGIYVAHLLVEAILVGGVYYFWPSRGGDDQPSRSMKLHLDPVPPNPPKTPARP